MSLFFGNSEENASLKEELKTANKKLEITLQKLFEANKELAELKAELELAKELLESARAAKENGCIRGEYCGQCKHHVMVHRYRGETEPSKCVCTYGTCPHFEKEADHEPN